MKFLVSTFMFVSTLGFSIDQNNSVSMEALVEDSIEANAKFISHCSDLLSEEQKIAIRDLFLQTKKSMIPVVADLKTAMIDYLLNLSNTSEEAGSVATSIGNDVVALKTQKLTLAIEMKNQIFFEILNQDQRWSMMKCIRKHRGEHHIN